MATIQTDEYGECLSEWTARRFLERFGLHVVNSRGALIFRYPDQAARRILPVFIHAKGWFYPRLELERDYVRPPAEVISDDNYTVEAT
jgi:hypothetical protein